MLKKHEVCKSKEQTETLELTEEELKHAENVFATQKKTRVKTFYANKLEKSQAKYWNTFYKHNGDRFYKDRHWPRREYSEQFAEASDKKMVLLELGCGVGNTIFPLLEEFPLLRAYGVDCSHHAINLIKAKPHYNPSICQVYQGNLLDCDLSTLLTPFSVPSSQPVSSLASQNVSSPNSPSSTQINPSAANSVSTPSSSSSTQDLKVRDIQHVENPVENKQDLTTPEIDIVTLFFVLSSFSNETQAVVVSKAASALKEGGMLLFRDYARYDMAQLRFGKNSQIDDNFYVRQDNTRSYFFEKDELIELMAQAGLRKVICTHHRATLVNRAKQQDMKRIWMHGVFEKVSSSSVPVIPVDTTLSQSSLETASEPL